MNASLAAPRELSRWAASVLLAALGAAIIIASPGVATIIIAIPPIGVGVLGLLSRPRSRAAGFAVSVAYAVIIGFVTTTPLRGVTPPPGQSRPPMDPAMILVTAGFVLAALLYAVAKGSPPRIEDNFDTAGHS